MILTRTAVIVIATGACLGVLLGAGVVLTQPDTAQAVTCLNNGGFKENYVAREDSGGVHRGTRSHYGMWVEKLSEPTWCDRVSSVLIVNNPLSYEVEAGWFDQSGATESESCYVLSSGPQAFFTTTVDNSYTCYVGPSDHGDAGTYTAGYGVDDPNDNDKWNFSHDGTNMNLGGPITIANFPYGLAVTNGERHDSSDSAWSDFQDLQYDSSTGWQNWGADYDWIDPKTAYCVKIYADPTHTAVLNSGDC